MKYKEDELREQAAAAITRLKELRAEYRHGWIDFDAVKAEAGPLIKAYDDYAKIKAQKFGVKARKFSLHAFLR